MLRNSPGRPLAALLCALLVVVAGCGQPTSPEGTAGSPTVGTDSPASPDSPAGTADTAPPDGAATGAGTGEGTGIGAGTGTGDGPGTGTADVPPNTSASATFLVDGEAAATVTLEVADDPAEQRRGLMNRTSLPANHGMVFVYDDAATRTFWMKNTKIPLDMIFVAPNGTVLNVAHADPQPNAADSQLRRYSSNGAAQYVIEVEQGFANRTGVGAGSTVQFDWTANGTSDETA